MVVWSNILFWSFTELGRTVGTSRLKQLDILERGRKYLSRLGISSLFAYVFRSNVGHFIAARRRRRRRVVAETPTEFKANIKLLEPRERWAEAKGLQGIFSVYMVLCTVDGYTHTSFHPSIHPSIPQRHKTSSLLQHFSIFSNGQACTNYFILLHSSSEAKWSWRKKQAKLSQEIETDNRQIRKGRSTERWPSAI